MILLPFRERVKLKLILIGFMFSTLPSPFDFSKPLPHKIAVKAGQTKAGSVE